MSKRIYLCLAHMSGNEMAYIQEAFDTNWVVPLGPNVNGFESDLEHFVNDKQGVSQGVLDKKVVALSAGTAAVHLALLACGVGRGDEVIVQSFTFCASSHPVTYLGATPVFVDSEEDTWNMNPQLLEQAIIDRMAVTGRKPKAIVPVYLYGMPAKIGEICAVAAKYDIEETFGKEAPLDVMHAGLECGILTNLLPELQMIAIGPTVLFPHSPGEKVSILSTERFWQLLIAVLNQIATKNI